MSFGPHLYAVVSRNVGGEAPKPKKRPIAEVKREKLVEIKQKQNIDRGNALIDRLELRIVSLDERIAALQRAKACAAARLCRIETRMVEEMEAWGLTTAHGFKTSLQLTMSPPSVDVFDADKLPPEYWRQPKTPAKQPDKVAIKSALTRQQKVPGARLVQGQTLKRS